MNDSSSNSDDSTTPNLGHTLDFASGDGAFPAYLQASVPLVCQQAVTDLLDPGETIVYLEPTLFSRSMKGEARFSY
jgi:hypothetical protein